MDIEVVAEVNANSHVSIARRAYHLHSLSAAAVALR